MEDKRITAEELQRELQADGGSVESSGDITH